MFKMFAQLWASMTVLFTALERVANSVNHLAAAGEILAEGVEARTRIENQAELIALRSQLKLPAVKA
jgi:hypothetical protein